MSIDIVRQENSRHPEHLRDNVVSTCYAYLSHVIELLTAAGRQAYFICKTAGEGQYTPPGWVPFTGPGLDGKPYTYTGVSHDALWCDGKQFDTAASANDSPDPIFNPDGSQIHASPVWNEIPQQHWRPQNPPLKTSTPTPQPPVKPYPGDPTWDAVGVTLFGDYAEAGQAPNPQMGRWFGRTIWDATEGDQSGVVLTVDASIAKHRAEWRSVLGLPTL